MDEKVDIIKFAKKIMGKKLFDYEVKALKNLKSSMQYSTFNEWVRPQKRENQYLMNIWLSYQEYLEGTFDMTKSRLL